MKKLTIEEMKKIAIGRGGRCLSNIYLNANSKLRWRCSKKHEWLATPGSVKSGKWCAICSGVSKCDIAEMKIIAKSKGGECLSKKYVNARTKIKWKCIKGHTWFATPTHIKSGTWCPFCKNELVGKMLKKNIKDMQKIAISRGGKCLSDLYINSNSRLKWKCKKGHIWEATPASINKHWCPKCATIYVRNKLLKPYSEILIMAKENKGELLSKNNLGMNKKHKWKCDKKHIFYSTPSNIARGHWCPRCSVEKLNNFKKNRLIDKINSFLKIKKGKIVSGAYQNNRSKLLWKCKQGHTWYSTYLGARRRWCPQCIANEASKLKIISFNIIFKYKGIKCISDLYINNRSPLKWKCKNGHIWEASVGSIKSCNECPQCAGINKYDILFAHNLAKKYGGVCLSKTYKNNSIKLKWRCAQGHTWKANLVSVLKLSKRWCPICDNRIPLTINFFKNLAKERGGLCLSEKYLNTDSKIKFQCKVGHQWETRPSLVKRGAWCPQCSWVLLGKEKAFTLHDAQILAKEKGGKCISKDYINAQLKLEWECFLGHRWKTSYNSIKNGSWCPECKTGLYERICRAYIEQILNKKFPKARPSWLKYSTSGQLELDGYCDSLKLAFEHHGEQHYSVKTHFVKTVQLLKKRIKVDRLKESLCKKNGVKLIIIPELFSRTPIIELKHLILKKLKEFKIPVSKNAYRKKITLLNIISPDKLSEIKKLASSKNGKLLSNQYLGVNYSYEWSCKEGHIWQARLSHIKRGSWCPHCAGRNKTIEDFKKIARDRKGECLSKKYSGAHSKLIWKCSKGHVWKAKPGNIKGYGGRRGTWCPWCRAKEAWTKRKLSS